MRRVRLFPQSIVGRTVLVLLVGLVVSHLIAMSVYYGDRRTAVATAGGRHLAERIATAVRMMEDTPLAARKLFVRSMWSPRLSVTWTRDSPVDGSDSFWRARLVRSALREYLQDLPSNYVRISYREFPKAAASPPFEDPWSAMREQIRRMSEGEMGEMPMPMHMNRMGQVWNRGPVLTVSVRLSDSTWLNFASPTVQLRPFWVSRIFFFTLLITATIIALSVWAVRRATQPLALFARTAERLGLDVNAPALTEEGPYEVRRASVAFNEMQKRLRHFIEDRTQMLAAISHDLRTPITRLRLRAELIDDEEQQKKMLADLEEMETMIAATLSFARDATASEPRQALDLAVLLQSLCDDATDAGRKAAYEGPDKFTYTGRPVALKRTFSNLIDNAIKYGNEARVSLTATNGGLTVTVTDSGPGIPDGELERVFQPFHRVERSRSRETGGTGLGLAVVRSIVRAHGGDVTLKNHGDGGLCATVTLPRE